MPEGNQFHGKRITATPLSPLPLKKGLTFLCKESLWPNIRPLPQLSSTSLAPLPKIQSIQIPIPGSHLVGTPTLKSPLPNASLDFQQHCLSPHLHSLCSSLFILHRPNYLLPTATYFSALLLACSLLNLVHVMRTNGFTV